MHREERRRKFHNAILGMLYPPPPSFPNQEDENDPVGILREGSDLDGINPDDVGEGSPSPSEEEEGDADTAGPKKLTRAQRKRLRKQKLKEEASRRRKIIGPLLLSTSQDDAFQHGPPGVRRNAAEEPRTSAIDNSENTQNKLKHRRMAKRLAKEEARSSSVDNLAER
ncbi:uncharacterized protein LOC131167106 [Malania oleifera]|uniref:uncharacterized protein LOC131167106 n=1 Tax=Malania oleifera TaxID=397392 RepID=UPI0025AEBB11|nr:uncharacterized protein LOC131167106 [Malania oleifera]